MVAALGNSNNGHRNDTDYDVTSSSTNIFLRQN